MPVESRFRLERAFDIEEAFTQRRSVEVFESPSPPVRFTAVATPVQRSRLGGDGLARSRMAGSSSRRRGRSSNSVLPSWYPRTPLRDITAITRAFERRRARLGQENGETAGDLVPSQQVQDAPPEHEVSATPSNIKKRPCPPPSVHKVHKILQEVANQPDEGESLTPQKKLLNSIDKVEKVVMEELQRLKRTPSAKKAEREKRVRTLMSMR